MSISKLLKSNNLIFFVIALVLMGFAVHSLGNRKNNMMSFCKILYIPYLFLTRKYKQTILSGT